MIRRHYLPLVILLPLLFLLPAMVWMQPAAAVQAEAIIEANLRAEPSVEAGLVGSIRNGTRYPVIGRSEFFPWLLVADPISNQPLGWVYQDLVTVYGAVAQVAFSRQVIGAAALPSPSLAAVMPLATQPAVTTGAVSPSLTPSATAFAATSAVIGEVVGQVNVRYGPGIEFPRIGVENAGTMLEITAYHTQVPWVQVRYGTVAGGFGWVAIDLLQINGNIYSLPSIGQTVFDLPTLTPTPNAVNAVVALPGFASAPLSPEFQALGESLWSQVLAAGFEPETNRLGSLFLMDLQTGEALSFGDDIAYSGMSLSKINILVDFFRSIDRLPAAEEARQLANMMICSENTSSNALLSMIGGAPYDGAANVTAMLQELGLQEMYMIAPFLIDPRITPQPVVIPASIADQSRTNPDPFNQMSTRELGWVLANLYQCAADGSGALTTAFSGQITQSECQQMLYLMSRNQIGALVEVGVPEGIPVAHKHGWVDDTHGDAAIVFTPGGDYVLVTVLYNPTWLNFEVSFPLIEELSRTVYNYYNPSAPMPATRASNVPETCDLSNEEGATIIDALMRGAGTVPIR